jgi:hypothetical protein
MALAPADKESFLRDVDDAVRADRLSSIFRDYGRWIIAALVLGLLALGVWFGMQYYRESQSGAHGKVLVSALDNLSQNRPRAASGGVAPLLTSGDATYRALANMVLGTSAAAERNARLANDKFGLVANDTAVEQAMRDAALVRQVMMQFDATPPATVITRLAPILARPTAPAFPSAAELTALAELKRGNDRAAGQLFKRIAETPDVADSLKARAVQMADMLGVDVAPAASNSNGPAATPARGESR